MAPNEEERKRVIFISHRHADKEIADTIRETLGDWSAGRILFFQSSDPQRSTRIGAPLAGELKNALVNADVVLLVYTFNDQDWSYCMWECGVATDPEMERMQVVVFQCTSDTPAPFQDQVRLSVTEEDEIRKFTEQFHKSPDFFPGFGEALSPDIGQDTLDRMSKSLYEKLSKVIPAKKPEERYRWDFFTLALDSMYVRKIRDERDGESAFKLVVETIPNNCIVKEAFGEAFKHFGFDEFEEGKNFADLVNRWEQSVGDSPKEWISELYAEISRAIRNIPAEPTWACLKSARRGADWWFSPVVNHVRILPDDSMEFDIYIYRVPIDLVPTSSETAT